MQMIFFAALMMWAFDWKEYQLQPGEPHTSVWRPLLDSINLCTPSPSILPFIRYIRILLTHLGAGTVGDFAVEIGSEFTYFASRITGRQHQPASTKRSLGQAFGVEGYAPIEGELRSNVYATSSAPRTSYDEDIRLTPYKASTPDLSRVRSPEDIDTYRDRLEESTPAA